MNKFIKMLSVLISIILLTGCMDIKVNMKISSDKSLDVNMNYEINLLKMMQQMADGNTIDIFKGQFIQKNCESLCADDTSCITECMSSVESNPTEIPSEEEMKQYLKEYMNSEEFNTESFFDSEQKSKLENKGYKVDTKVDKDNFIISIKISQHFSNIEDVSTNQETILKIGELFTGEQENIFFTKKDSNIYQAKFKWDDEDIKTENDFDIKQYLTFTYETTLPNKSITHNATKVSTDGKTLTWEFSTQSKNDINYEFSFNNEKSKKETSNNSFNKSDIIGYSLVMGGIILILTTIIIYIKTRKQGE